MKTLISILCGVLIFYLIFFKLDPFLVNAIISTLPESISEWLTIIKIAIWVIILLLTSGIGIGLSILIGGLVRLIIN